MKINNYISSFWNRLAVSSLSELVELFGDKIPWPDVPPVRQIRKGIKVREAYEYRDRVYNQWRTFWMFLSQLLSSAQTCSEALKKAKAWIWLGGKKKSRPTRLLIASLAVG